MKKLMETARNEVVKVGDFCGRLIQQHSLYFQPVIFSRFQPSSQGLKFLKLMDLPVPDY